MTAAKAHEQAENLRALRYLAPNLITAASVVFGLLAIAATIDGRTVDAGWYLSYAVLTDRLDGFVARLVRGTSELGVQLDSLADLINFGVAPALLMYITLGSDPLLPFTEGSGRLFLQLSCVVWVFGATFRLARYNISSDVPGNPKIFFGVPTTMAAGLLVVWYLTLAKYADPSGPMYVGEFGGARLFGDFVTPEAAWRWLPAVLIVGGLAMASNLRMPKLGVMRSKLATGFVFANVLAGTVCAILQILPDYMIWPPTAWLLLFIVWGQISPEARRMRPPPMFPSVDPPPGQEPIRPEDDLLPLGEDGLDLDEQLGDRPADSTAEE